METILGRPVRVLASGRTDAGVHALGQVVGFRTPTDLPQPRSCSGHSTPTCPATSPCSTSESPDDFHPISHAVRKRYRYVIHDGPVRDIFSRHFCWHYAHGRLDAEAMHRAAAALLGKHDFSSFETSGADAPTSVRTIFDIRVQRGRAGQGGAKNRGQR